MINSTKIIERAKRKLGSPTIDLELEDEQMASLLKDAYDTFFLYSSLSDLNKEKKDEIEDGWVKKYFYALCKETLGRIRGKYEKININNVETKLDSETLLSESEKEKLFLKYLLFKDKEILEYLQTQNAVFVVYLNSVGKSKYEISQTIEILKDSIKKINGFSYYFIPTKDETRIECIYPVNKELDKNGYNIINKLNNHLNKLTKKSETLINKVVVLDLGGIGPKNLIIEEVSDDEVFLRYDDTGKMITLSVEDFQNLSGIKIKENEEQI